MSSHSLNPTLTIGGYNPWYATKWEMDKDSLKMSNVTPRVFKPQSPYKPPAEGSGTTRIGLSENARGLKKDAGLGYVS